MWLHLNQLLRSWLFATISSDLLAKDNDILHAFPIWEHLSHRSDSASLTRVMVLKRMLANLSKDEHQFMEDYLCGIKQIVDLVFSIHSPVSRLDLVHLTLAKLMRTTMCWLSLSLMVLIFLRLMIYKSSLFAMSNSLNL